MAEKALQEVEDELTCSICLDTYTDPKLLQCFHVYCLGCIRRVGTDRDQQGQLILTCPECRQLTPVPAGGAKGLRSAYHINRLLGIMKHHKESQDGSADDENPAHTNTNPPPANITPHCPEHADEELKLYCETCGEVICYKCAIKGLGKHHDHKSELLEAAFQKYKEEIMSSLKLFETHKASIKQALQQVETCCNKVIEQRATVEANIIPGQFQARQWITQLHSVTEEKLAKLAAQENQLKSLQAQLRSCEDFMKESMKMDSYYDVMEMKMSTLNQVKRLTSSFRSELLKLCTEPDILYSESSNPLNLDTVDDKSKAILFVKGE